MEDRNQYIALVNTRGRVIWARGWELDNLKAQGCRRIINPREEYYPEYDLSLQNASPPPDEVYKEEGGANILEGRDV